MHVDAHIQYTNIPVPVVCVVLDTVVFQVTAMLPTQE